MKKVFSYLKDYYQTGFSWAGFLLLLAFLAMMIWLNVTYEIETGFLYRNNSKPIGLLYYFLFFAFPWIVGWLIQKVTLGFEGQGGKEKLENQDVKFWLRVLFVIFVLSFATWFPYYRDIAALVPDEMYSLARKILWNLKSSFFFFVPLFLFWAFIDKKKDGFYGLTFRKFDPRPYFFMLVIVLPLIVYASFQDNFLRMYPTYLTGSAEKYLGVSGWVTSLVYELIYGFDFTFVELLFRGFMVIGMARWMGKGAIMPMVAVYCFLHFGKPWQEAGISIFGGWILGIVALYSRNIFGGVIVHIGLAWMMEAAAHIQLAFNAP